MEAMSMQIPCVTTNIAGIPELIRDGIDGLLVAPGDVDALAVALARLMDDADLSSRLASSGRARVLESYTLALNVKALAAVFTERAQAEVPLKS
jgi:glycosyltransferase involved in cell wall biosynthesis